MPRRTAQILGMAAGAALAAAGCQWSSRSGLPEHVRTVAVPVFGNQTTEFGLETALTQALRRAVHQDPRVRLANGDADATLSGKIIEVRRRSVRESRDDRPSVMQVTLVAEYSFFDENAGRWIAEDVRLDSGQAASARGLHHVSLDPRLTPEEAALAGAVDALAAEMTRRTLGMW